MVTRNLVGSRVEVSPERDCRLAKVPKRAKQTTGEYSSFAPTLNSADCRFANVLNDSLHDRGEPGTIPASWPGGFVDSVAAMQIGDVTGGQSRGRWVAPSMRAGAAVRFAAGDDRVHT